MKNFVFTNKKMFGRDSSCLWRQGESESAGNPMVIEGIRLPDQAGQMNSAVNFGSLFPDDGAGEIYICHLTQDVSYAEGLLERKMFDDYRIVFRDFDNHTYEIWKKDVDPHHGGNGLLISGSTFHDWIRIFHEPQTIMLLQNCSRRPFESVVELMIYRNTKGTI